MSSEAPASLIDRLVACSVSARINTHTDIQTDRQTDRQTNYSNPRCTCALRVNKGEITAGTDTTVEPPKKGHNGANDFVPCREVIPIPEVKQYTKVLAWGWNKCPL